MGSPQPIEDRWLKRYLRDVGEQIRKRRMALCLTQREVAEKLAWSRTTVVAIEAARQRLTVEQLCLLAAVLRTPARSCPSCSGTPARRAAPRTAARSRHKSGRGIAGSTPGFCPITDVHQAVAGVATAFLCTHTHAIVLVCVHGADRPRVHDTSSERVHPGDPDSGYKDRARSPRKCRNRPPVRPRASADARRRAAGRLRTRRWQPLRGPRDRCARARLQDVGCEGEK
jgi:DNA-binding XRE family transcriptional regulator